MRVIDSRSKQKLIRENLRAVKELCPNVTSSQLEVLRELGRNLSLSLRTGDLVLLDGRWYITHSGLLRIAQRRRCQGITTELAESVSDPQAGRWVFRATVVKSKTHNFVGFGDADPSNVSDLVRGAEMRVAETRAVNRALRKAYGIGICSVEEMGARAEFQEPTKLPSQPSNGNGTGRTVRDRLCQIIRQYQLDANLVKAYATDSCAVKTLREASREQVENFVAQLAEWAERDLNALRCQLNSYASQKEEVA